MNEAIQIQQLRLFVFAALVLILFQVEVVIEPDWLERTQVEVKTARLPVGSRLRIVHLSDLHVEGWTKP
ncbi:hypothetical protein F0U62_28820 [Cystobacter fuscus]|uniref:hypothetical protein n=1 Tax=Cystobacter fuscus TaxID=43 RepID=UPI002B2FD911|nr:hypothetical protein F0U62_28820 [Cystobacter fuscus]